MNRSLKLLAALSLSALVFGAPVRAADEGGKKPEGDAPKKRPEGGARQGPADRLQGLADQLNLTAEQKEKAQPIIQETHDAVEKIMSDASIDQKDKRPKMMDAVKAGTEKLTALLTDEQKAKLKEIQAARREGGGKKGDGAKKGGDKN